MRIKNLLFFLFLLGFSTQSLALHLLFHPTIKDYIQTTCQKYGFDREVLTDWFKKVHFDKRVLVKMTTPSESKSWDEYYNITIKPKRIAQGIKFWKQNADFFQQTQHQYGVPPEIILGILGVETAYGNNEGSYPVFNTLATLAFKYPPRSPYFKQELTQYLLLTREQNWDPFKIKSSYAGALGMPQFMPSSYRIYAVNSDRKSTKDLFHNSHDAIASVANYLREKGWKPDQPVAIRALLINQNHTKLNDTKGKLFFTVEKLKTYGLIPVVQIPSSLKAGLLVFQSKKGAEYWIIFSNFEVIKKYNASNKYAIAVYELGRIISAKKNLSCE